MMTLGIRILVSGSTNLQMERNYDWCCGFIFLYEYNKQHMICCMWFLILMFIFYDINWSCDKNWKMKNGIPCFSHIVICLLSNKEGEKMK
jgi:hypothetical protein